MTLLRRTVLAFFAIGVLTSPARAEPPLLDASTRMRVVDTLIRQLNDYYVFPDVAGKIGKSLRDKQARGGYDEIADAEVFANVLTADLREMGRDKHLRVSASDTLRPNSAALSPDERDEKRRQIAARGYGIAKIETLSGNIGYLDLSGFVRVELAAASITAAMTRLADSDALIIDVRNNGGGDPAAVAFLSSYLFDVRTHLNDLYAREDGKIVEYWTDIKVAGKRYGQQKAVYVLTAPATFSAGEEFSYNLKQLKRATLVGEATGGGANPGRMRELTPYFAAFIPYGRAINPITKTNWEGSGVLPDISVPARQALLTAHRLALEKLAVASADPQRRLRLRATIDQLH